MRDVATLPKAHLHLHFTGAMRHRTMLELAAQNGETRKVGELAELQNIPPRFLENILVALRHAGLVHSRRGTEGGFWLARPADQISVADVAEALAESPRVTWNMRSWSQGAEASGR